MYTIILVVCLLSLENKCIALREEPPQYYETTTECEKQMGVRANDLAKALQEAKEQGQMTGKCVYVSGIKPT